MGEISNILRETGLDENTLVFFTSDNGVTTRRGRSNAPLRGRKGQVFEGGIRVPCIADPGIGLRRRGNHDHLSQPAPHPG